MKQRLLLLLTVFIYSFNSFSQNEGSITTSTQDPYLVFRSEKMFFIKESSDEKIVEYPLLTSITCLDINTNEEKIYSPEEFIVSFKKGEINNLSLQIKRDRFIELSYRVGSTGYVLIGRSEEKIASEFNKSIK